jgi:hypothetical protein
VTRSFTTPLPTFTKALLSSDLADTAGAQLAVGEQVTFRLTVTLPEGTTRSRCREGLRVRGVAEVKRVG